MAANSYRNVFLTNLQNILASGNTSLDLGIGEIGIVDSSTNVSTTTPQFPTNRSIQIVQGNTDKRLPKGMLWGNQSLRSPEIQSNAQVTMTVIPAQHAQNMIVTLGYDGIDTTKTLAPVKDKMVRLYVTLFGQPIANLVANTGNHPASITETFDLLLPCVDECVDNCGSLVDCNAVADAIISQMQVRNTIGSIPLIDGAIDGEPGLLRLTKLLHCTTPSGYPITTCHKWALTIADTGDQVALGKVEAQYPGYTVTRDSRNGVYSTYNLTVCSGATPTPYDSNNADAIPNCTTCPSGFVLQAELPVFSVGRTDAGTSAAMDTFKTDFGGLIVLSSVTRLSYVNGYSTYQVFGNASTTLANMQTRATAVGKGDFVAQIGTNESLCIPIASVTTAWTDTGATCGVATKYYQLTLKDSVCGTSWLTALQAEYGSNVTEFSSNGSTCTRVYHLPVTSANTCVECASVSDQYFVFTKPVDFQGSQWIAIGGNPAGTGCACGVRFESAYVQRDRKECFFEDVSYEVEPLFIYVSTNNPDFRDFSTLCDDAEQFPVTIVQGVKYRAGYGSLIADQVKQSNFYFNQPWYNDPAVRDAIGYELRTDLQGYYDQVTLVWRSPIASSSNFSGFGLSQFEEYEFTVYTPEGTSGTLVTALNSWLSSTGNQPVV